MNSQIVRQSRWAAAGLFTSTILMSGLPAPVYAQAASGAAEETELEEIVVTGYRKSLEESGEFKRNQVGFADGIFAEDMGKFPDTNIAESFNRIPGITINREITGEGLNVAIRGLGTNFTRILLNNAAVAIASTGRTDSQNTNREIDLDLFPTELFTQLTVSKSPLASQLEGGAAGTVNMRSARPFDNEGEHFAYSAQGIKNSESDKWGQRGSFIASKTWDDKFGVLLGLAGVHNNVRVTGFETIGWTNANLSASQCATGCNSTGGGNWTIPGTVPANAGNGLTPGTVVDQAFLLANNPGRTIQQIDNAIIPRLGRPSDEFGTKDRYNGVLALEYRPSDELHFFIDSMYGRKKNNLERIDMNWVGRNGAMIPLNLEVDQEDCSLGCTVTSGTFANAQFFLEYRPFIEDTEFWGTNPGFEWQATDMLKVNVNANWTESDFHRESPTVLVITPASSGVTVEYQNDGGVPVIGSNVDLNDPSIFGWPGGRVNIQDERRETKTKGVRGDITWGDEALSLNFGGSYDDVSRRISAFDNSQAWQNAVCGNNPSAFVPSPNSQPACQGLNQPGAAPAGYPTYPGLAGGVTYQGSLIPNAAVGNYLVPGPSGFVTVDWDRFKEASDYDFYHDSAPETGSSNTGASGGYVREKVTGFYAEVNGNTDLGDNMFRYNVGLRYVHTKQTIGGRVSIPDNRNTPADPADTPLDGGRFPNIVNFVTTENSYDNWLPSANVAYNVSDNAVVRAALSRTMTRPNPNSMLPGLNFSTPSADVGSVGNNALDPFLSDNIDLGFEYYMENKGYFSVAAFRKEVEGFTVTGTSTVPFSNLALYGVTYDTLTPTQQAAIDARGGPNNANVVLQQQVNATGTLTVNGLEFNWVQPLDFVGLDGFGYTANFTIIDQKGEGAAPAVAIGVARYAYNASFYYEKDGISARVSTTYNEGSQTSGTNQNGIPLAALYSNDYQQWDFSSSFDLAELFDMPYAPQLTVDMINIFDRDQRSYFQFENAAFTSYTPGRTVIIGLRGKF